MQSIDWKTAYTDNTIYWYEIEFTSRDSFSNKKIK